MSKTTIKTYSVLFLVSLLMMACTESGNGEHEHEHEHAHGNEEEVHFTSQQFNSLGMKVDTLKLRNISSFVEANGQLEVPPQSEATVTSIVGANISTINVIEGDKVKKGQILAYLSHPNLLKLQTDYIKNWNDLQYLEKEYQRQKKLYNENVVSGKEFQKTQADYQTKIALVKSFEAQLKQIGLNLNKLQKSEIYSQVPVISPIKGYIRLVEVKTGQFVQPQKELFEIINIEHIHADFMVFEKDMHKVKEGQKIKFTCTSLPNKELSATILSVGKAFEKDPKAIHLHAEIENKKGLLIPGMYVRGRIMIKDEKRYVLPEEAIFREGEKHFIFSAKKEKKGWLFKPLEVTIGENDNGWIQINLIKTLKKGTLIAWNNAYYLMADMKKEEAEHSH